MVDAKLIVNGNEFPIHYKMLSVIADNLPDSRHYAPLAHALLALDVPSITLGLIRNDALSLDDLDAIWEKGDLDLRRRLVDENIFRSNLTDAQAEQIIAINDSEILKSLARYAERLYPDKGKKQAMRLSGKMADALLEFMANHSDGDVRRELAENYDVPAKFRPSFAEMVKMGIVIWHGLVDDMTQDDLDLLSISPLEILKTVANSVEDIKDSEVREKVIDFLCSHPDPAIRLELAENSAAPHSALRRLTEDSDLDVVQAAWDSLPTED